MDEDKLSSIRGLFMANFGRGRAEAFSKLEKLVVGISEPEDVETVTEVILSNVERKDYQKSINVLDSMSNIYSCALRPRMLELKQHIAKNAGAIAESLGYFREAVELGHYNPTTEEGSDRLYAFRSEVERDLEFDFRCTDSVLNLQKVAYRLAEMHVLASGPTDEAGTAGSAVPSYPRALPSCMHDVYRKYKELERKYVKIVAKTYAKFGGLQSVDARNIEKLVNMWMQSGQISVVVNHNNTITISNSVVNRSDVGIGKSRHQK